MLRRVTMLALKPNLTEMSNIYFFKESISIVTSGWSWSLFLLLYNEEEKAMIHSLVVVHIPIQIRY